VRVLINYCYQYYPFTTASYLEMALKADKRFTPFRIGEQGIPCADLIINVEPCDFVVSYPGRKSCLWEIDNHIQQAGKVDWYERVDHVFVAQKFFLPLYPQEKTSWLPLAADPEKHRLFSDEPLMYDVGFLGNNTYTRRGELLKKIGEKYRLLCSTSDPGEAYSRQLSRCKLLFNCSMNNDMNMRFFESMSIGRMLLSDKVDGQDDLFNVGRHYVSYTDWPELDRKIEYYLNHDQEREKIASTGAAFIRAKHTYQDRLEAIIREMGFY